MIICIVGKSGSGKSYICKLLKSYSTNILHLDIDIIGHQVLLIPDVINNLVNTFGESILYKDSIDRKALAKIVFNSEEQMNKHIEITWKYMELLIDEYISKHKDNIILLDWQLLPKTKYFSSSDLSILINAPFEQRKQKVIDRDHLNEDAFLLREKASYDFDNLKFDYIINNDFSNNIKEKVREIYDKSIISR